MNPKLALLATAALVTLSLGGCTRASQTPTSPTTTDHGTAEHAVKPAAQVAALVPAGLKDKTVTVAMDASYPPFEFFASGNKIVGFDADFSMAVVQRMGLHGTLVNTSFDSILTGLAGGRYDMAESSFSITPERKKVVDFVTYLQGGAGIAVKPGNPDHLAMKPLTLCGHTIAAQKGTTQAIEQLPKIRTQCINAGKAAVAIKLFPSQNEAVLALTGGRVDGMMADATAISYDAKLSGGKFQLAPGEIYEPRPTGIALPKGSPLKSAVSAAVKSLYTDGTAKRLAAKWSVPVTNLAPNPGA